MRESEDRRWEVGRVLALFAVAAAARWALGHAVAGPYIFTDELQTVAMAREFPGGRGLTWGGIPTYYPCWLYPALIAPFFKWLAWDAAYGWVRALNAALMAAAVFPAYGLAREAGGRRAALGAAALTALLPGAGYSPTIMTENLFLPVFTLGLWLIYRAVARPTAWRRLAAGLACGLAYHVKPHGLLLPLIAAATIVIYERFRIPRSAFRIYLRAVGRHWLTAAGWAVAMAPRAAEVLWRERPGEGLTAGALLGGYAGTARGVQAYTAGMLALTCGGYLAAWAWCAGLLPAWTLWRAIRERTRTDTDRRTSTCADGEVEARTPNDFHEAGRLLAILAAVASAATVGLAVRHTLVFNAQWKLHERYFFAALPALFALFATRARAMEGGWVGVWWRALLAAACAAGLAAAVRVMAWEIPNSAPSLTGALLLAAKGAGAVALAAWLAPLGAGMLLFIIRPGGPARQMAIVALLLAGMNGGWYGFHARLLSRWSAPALEVARAVDRLVPPGGRLAVLADGMEEGLAWRVATRNPGWMVSLKAKGRPWYAHELQVTEGGEVVSPFERGRGWLLAGNKWKFENEPEKVFKNCSLYRFEGLLLTTNNTNK